MAYFICSICVNINSYFKHIIYSHSFSKTYNMSLYKLLQNYINPYSLKKHINRRYYYENR